MAFEGEEDTVQLQVVLSQSGSSVSGTYTLIAGIPLGTGSMTGTYTHPDIRLTFTLTVEFFGSVLSTVCTYTATVHDARMSMQGTLLCPAAADTDIELEEIRVDRLTLTK